MAPCPRFTGMSRARAVVPASTAPGVFGRAVSRRHPHPPSSNVTPLPRVSAAARVMLRDRKRPTSRQTFPSPAQPPALTEPPCAVEAFAVPSRPFLERHQHLLRAARLKHLPRFCRLSLLPQSERDVTQRVD